MRFPNKVTPYKKSLLTKFPLILEKFCQSDKSHHSEGNGLGLPLVWRIVNLHEGIVHVESAVGKGSVFTATLV